MSNIKKLFGLIFFLILILPSLSSVSYGKILVGDDCKDVIVPDNATKGDYNLFLKVRDPSRPGPQVICIVNPGYSYNYSLPSWKKDVKKFYVEHRFIGVASKGDTPPNIIKAGIALSDAGIAYGDADSPSYWINPSPNAWDDFDWIRYACEQADNENEACNIMTKKAIDELHAPAVSENLFIVGPNKAYIIEGDAYRYSIKKVNNIEVMSNYPKELWKYRLLRRLFISPSFNTVNEKIVRKGSIINLDAILGIKILNINGSGLTVRLFPLGKTTFIKRGEGSVIGPYWIEVLNCFDRKAKILLEYKYKKWEEIIRSRLNNRYGEITVKDLMNLSRLHSDQLLGLRGMCEKSNKAAAVCKIPKRNYDVLSCMWFSPDQCSSIFVPVHVCCRKVYEPYENGEAAYLSKQILEEYGHGKATPYLSKAEDIFLNEVDKEEKIANFLLNTEADASNVSNLVNRFDIEIQKQAYLTMKLIYYAGGINNNRISNILKQIWSNNYSSSILNFKNALGAIKDNYIRNILSDILISIARMKIVEISHLSGFSTERTHYEEGISAINGGDYSKGCDYIYSSMSGSNRDNIEMNESAHKYKENQIQEKIIIFCMIASIATLAMLTAYLSRKRNRKN